MQEKSPPPPPKTFYRNRFKSLKKRPEIIYEKNALSHLNHVNKYE